MRNWEIFISYVVKHVIREGFIVVRKFVMLCCVGKSSTLFSYAYCNVNHNVGESSPGKGRVWKKVEIIYF